MQDPALDRTQLTDVSAHEHAETTTVQDTG